MDLINRLQEVLLSGKWIANTNVWEQIAPLDRERATHKVADLNTIAALTFHLDYYLAGICQVFEGGELTIRDKFSFDLPPLETEADWESLKQCYRANAERFVAHVEKMDEAQLAAGFVKEEYGSYRRNIEGVIEHSYYHLGQMVLINKLFAGG